MSDKVSTVGDLTGHHIGHGAVRFFLPISTITGVITDLSYDDHYDPTMAGEKRFSTTATVRVGNILLEDLPLSTPCSSVATEEPERDTDTLDDF